MTQRTTPRTRTAIDLKLSDAERQVFESMSLEMQQAYVDYWLSEDKPYKGAHRDSLAAFRAGWLAR